MLGGCSGMPEVRMQLGSGGGGRAPAKFTGLIAADEPQAVLAAQEILRARGNAFDAAVTLGFTLTVTLPSSAGLGGGGACIIHDARSGLTEILDFTVKVASDDGAARFRAAVPAFARGMFALHAKYGALPWQQLVAPAENLARFGHPVTRAFARDLAADGGALLNDRTALAAFMTPRRQTLQAGDTLKQFDLSMMLGRLRARGPGNLYAGALGQDLEDVIARAGGAITALDLRTYVPRWLPAPAFDEGPVRVYYVPEEVGHGDFAKAYAAAGDRAPTADAMSGATGFVIADAAGSMVTCGLTMGQPFGLGIMPPGLGFLLAPAPDAPAANQTVAPVMAIAIAANRMVFAGASGDIASSAAAAKAVVAESRTPAQIAEAWRGPSNQRGALVNMLACPSAGQSAATCEAQADPRGAGYAIVVTPEE